MPLNVGTPAPVHYSVHKEGPAGEALYDISVTLPRTTAADARASLRAALDRLRAARYSFLDEVAARGPLDERPETDPDRRWYERLGGGFATAEEIVLALSPVLACVPDDSFMDGPAWAALERAVLSVERLAVGVGMVKEEG